MTQPLTPLTDAALNPSTERVAIGAPRWLWDEACTAGMHIELPEEFISVTVSLLAVFESRRPLLNLTIVGSTGIRTCEWATEIRTRQAEWMKVDCGHSLDQIVHSAWFATKALPAFMTALYASPKH